jgi:sugar-specific transcriptional regulator TrmB
VDIRGGGAAPNAISRTTWVTSYPEHGPKVVAQERSTDEKIAEDVLAWREISPMKDVKPILVALGLQESEVATYLTSLAKGPGSIADIAHASGYSRQAVYVAVESLTKRGLMSSSGSGKKMLYSAEHPERLLAYAHRREAEMKDRIEDLARIVPQLELQSGGEKPVVRVFEGDEAIRSYLHELESQKPKEMYELTDVEAMKAVLTEQDLKPLREVLRKSRVKGVGIYTGAPITQNEPSSERYFLGEEHGGFKSNIGLYGDVLSFITFAGKKHSIIIESKYLAKGFKLLFQLAQERAAQLTKKK